MHGGAPGSGAPRGNQNARKHGHYSREAIAMRQQTKDFVKNSRQLLNHFNQQSNLAKKNAS
jgi:uncharacterized protein YjcR